MLNAVIIDLTSGIILRGLVEHENFLGKCRSLKTKVFLTSLLKDYNRTMKYYSDTGLEDKSFLTNLQKEYEIIYILGEDQSVIKNAVDYNKFHMVGYFKGLYIYHIRT